MLVFGTVDALSAGSGGLLAGGLDAHVYRVGADRVLHGQPLYTEPTFFGLQYTYTPFSALAFLPILAVPWSLLTYVALLLNAAALYGCVLASVRMLGYRTTSRTAGVAALLAITCLFLEPVRTTLFYGQVNLVLMLLVLWDVSRPETSRLRGLGVGVAAGVKLVPAYFVAHYLALRRWRAAACAATAFVGTIALAWIVLPADSQQYWFSTFFDSDRIALDTDPANQSIRGVLAHLMHGAAPLWLWAVLAGAVALSSLWLTATLERRGERLLAVTIAGLTSCAVSPFAWGHHWVWFVPFLVHLVHQASTSPRWWAAAAALVVCTGAWAYHWGGEYVSVGIFLLPKPWHSEPVLENSHVLVYVAVLLYGVVRSRRIPMPRSGTAEDPAAAEPSGVRQLAAATR
ncbi:DUF2029 domain-containing protein [Nocardia stercoris]|uniref:DUF2029 domain-containing protein n=1 Tax=Nocardia stercoris TaxID=2483361 RepID=A0A3M2L8G0_9NOCA|nr:DUF2029 domain-containing protein [Nocardia stercoris]